MAKGKKITILGAGNVGATTAYALAVQGIASEIVLVDIFKEKAIGEADDIIQGAPFLAPFKIYAGDYDAAAGSDIVVFTLGKPRQPGMTRIDLVNSNVALFKADVVPPIVKNAPDAVYVVVSNPVDILTYAVTKLSGLPPTRIVGSGTLLDTSRLRAILSARWNVCCSNVDAYVLGEHGDTSFIPWSLSSIFGVNAATYAEAYAGEKKPDWKDEVLTDVREAGARVIKNKRATFFAIALSVCEICKNILNDTNKILPVGSVLDGQYGIKDVCVSLPLAVGAQGISRGLLPKLAPEEEAALHKSAEAIKPFFEGI
jgi:L-lactate dehydrogenase